MIDRLRQRLLCASFLCALAACGGGGGGSSPPPPPPPPPPTGPAPLAALAAGALGAVLVANAADLRPTADGAQWSFHARQLASDGSTTELYDSTISQVADSSGGFAENDFQVFGDNGGIELSIANGQVTDRFSTTSDASTNVVVSALELRSPVQVNDRYVQWHATSIDVGDVDGDGKDDLAEILVYSTVIGTEPVTLPELHRTVAAVHVDTTTLLRVTLSSTGALTPIQNAVQSTWYAAGVGVVRQTETATATSGTGPIQYDEVLYSWNGVSAGLGAAGPTAIELPQDLWCCTTAEYLPAPFAAAVVGDEALLLSGSNAASTPSNVTASVVSSDGRLLRAAELSTLGGYLSTFGSNSLFGTGDTSALLVGISADSTGHLQVSLQALDDTPAAVGSPHTIPLPATNSIAATAWDGQQLWVMWEQTFDIAGNQLMLQPFDANGNALAPAQMLDSTSVGGMGPLRLAGANGAVLATWATESFAGTAYHYATVSGRTAAAQVFLLGNDGRGYTGSVNENEAPEPVLGSGVAALLWRGPIFSTTATGPLPDENPRGVVLDTNGQPVRSTSGTLDDETLPVTWATPSGQPQVAAALGGRLFFAGYAQQQASSFTTSLVDMLYTSFVQPGASPLATAAPNATTFAAAGNDWAQGLLSESPTRVLLWPDRALVIGTFPQGTAFTSVWLN